MDPPTRECQRTKIFLVKLKVLKRTSVTLPLKFILTRYGDCRQSSFWCNFTFEWIHKMVTQGVGKCEDREREEKEIKLTKRCR